MDIKFISQGNFSSLLQNSQIDLAILPLGSTEQHGDHLPLATDTLIVEHISKILSERARMILLPSIFYGVSYEHEPLFNISLDYNVLVDLISNICNSLYKQGIKRVFVINGHHGNLGLLQYVGQNLFTKYGIESNFFYFINYWQMIDQKFDHAGEIETSLMLAINPELVKMDVSRQGFDITNEKDKDLYKMGLNMSINSPGGFVKFTKNGIWGNPQNATIDKGQKMLVQIIENTLKLFADPRFV
ncbi:creatininase family protein [Candidatus Nitrosocosmicus franklandus]|uniref:Creatinine amidohydrolase n=1 Tax=Candidatus Nitrosocosmicus franklandianus TaxID=1798806 RepID=A0A484IF75_9ARCH|nr:creatininase family protein [Candidatus Nitrosocosmicus franklandus]VFJ14671.1 Creatinine amidohydrolase [Candidatus Nitrosocosmicus franklandus]